MKDKSYYEFGGLSSLNPIIFASSQFSHLIALFEKPKDIKTIYKCASTSTYKVAFISKRQCF
jgi:hypothetical protein